MRPIKVPRMSAEPVMEEGEDRSEYAGVLRF